MAAESYIARASGRLTEATLRLRQPARRFAGSVTSAVIKGAVVTGVYCLVVGSVVLWRPWYYNSMSPLVQASAGFAFITAVMDIVVIFSLLVKEDQLTKYTLCATMAVYMVALPLTVCTILGVMIMGYFDIPLWEMPRFFISLVHLALMYCLLAELRGDPLASTPPPPPEAGWLKNNLARTGPPPPAGDEALLKLQVEQNNARPGATNGGPAVFAPSSCTTAAPVHPLYPPPPAPGPAPAPAPAITHASVAAPPASGPASTSEA